MSKVLVNPSLPLWHSIPGSLMVGSMVEIRGKVPYGADVFHVNFTGGRDVGGRPANRIFHMSVRFPVQAIVRNSQILGEWGSEERGGRFPFSPGKSFLILILVEGASYKVAIDGQHCFEFLHRLDKSSATFLHIDGSVRIDEVRYFMQPGSYVGTCVPPQVLPAGHLNQTVYNPPVPFTYPLPGGLVHGMNIYIQGRPSASVSRFTINLQCGIGPYPTPDIAFHMDVRHFSYSVVRNTRVNGQWGKEELQIPNFPFQPAVNFDMIIRVERNKYLVTINGIHFAEFKHRVLPLSRVTTLCIENDIVISSVRFQ